MTWTTPRTWVAGEVVTAAIMNTHVRDNLKDAAENAGISTAFPGSPVRGQRFVLDVTATQTGTLWTCVYRDDLDATYPWHVIGGPPLEADSAGTSATVTVPKAGHYTAWGGGHASVSSGGDAGVTSPQATAAFGQNFATDFGAITAIKAASSTFTATRAGTVGPAGAVAVLCIPRKIV